MAKNLLSFSIEKWPHDDLVFTAPTEKGLENYADVDVEKRIADFNDEEGLVKAFSGVDTMILISIKIGEEYHVHCYLACPKQLGVDEFA